MTTMTDLVADTRRQVYGSLTEQLNIVAAPAAAGAGSIVLEMDVTGVTPGKVLSCGLNVWWVKGADANSKTVYVIPGFDNSPKQAVAAGDIVHVHPRVTSWSIFTQLNREIQRLSSPETGLYRIGTWTSPVDPAWQTYDIPSGALVFNGLLRVRYLMPGTPDVWFDMPESAYRVQQTDAGARIRLLRAVPAGSTMQFVYRAPFAQATSLTDDVSTVCGLADTMFDIPPLAVAYRLLRTTESQRNQISSQGDTRRPQEVQSMSNLQTSQLIERDYQRRVQEEFSRLVARMSYRRSL